MPKAFRRSSVMLYHPPPSPSNSLEPGSAEGKKAKEEAPRPYICPCHLKRGVFFNIGTLGPHSSVQVVKCGGQIVGSELNCTPGKRGRGGGGNEGRMG